MGDIYDIKFAVLQVRKNEISLRKSHLLAWEGNTGSIC